MKKNARAFLAKTLGSDFLESLGTSLSKSEVYKQGTRTVTDTDDLFQGLQIVPRTLLNLLVRELSPMQIDEIKEIPIPSRDDTFIRVNKLERDSYSGQVFQRNVKIGDFLNRSLPGLGLVLMTMLELYSMDELEKEPSISEDKQSEINRIIDERLNLHSLVNKVVDGKMQQKDAIQQLLMARLTEEFVKEKTDHEQTRTKLAATGVAALGYVKPGEVKQGDYAHSASLDDVMRLKQKSDEAPKVIILEPKKSRPLSEFIENRKKKLGKKEFSIEMAKSETVDCPDCSQTVFNKSGISACLCYGQDMGRKVFLKKTEDGIKISFPKSWSPENIEMLLEVLRRKNG